MYTLPYAPSPYSNFLLSINSIKHINNNHFKIPQLRAGLPTSGQPEISEVQGEIIYGCHFTSLYIKLCVYSLI
jgi:hypothetical protein